MILRRVHTHEKGRRLDSGLAAAMIEPHNHNISTIVYMMMMILYILATKYVLYALFPTSLNATVSYVPESKSYKHNLGDRFQLSLYK